MPSGKNKNTQVNVVLSSFDKMSKNIIKQTAILKEYFQLNFIYYQLVSGHGLDFDRIRQFSVGDDVRRIDWKIYGKKHELFSRVYKEERQFNIVIVMDVSNSMLLGTTKSTKTEYASLVASVIANTASEVGDLNSIVIHLANHQQTMQKPFFKLAKKKTTVEKKIGGKHLIC